MCFVNKIQLIQRPLGRRGLINAGVQRMERLDWCASKQAMIVIIINDRGNTRDHLSAIDATANG